MNGGYPVEEERKRREKESGKRNIRREKKEGLRKPEKRREKYNLYFL